MVIIRPHLIIKIVYGVERTIIPDAIFIYISWVIVGDRIKREDMAPER